MIVGAAFISRWRLGMCEMRYIFGDVLVPEVQLPE